MKCVELNREGDFERWEQTRLDDLSGLDADADPLDPVIYEAEGVKLSVFGLEPYERKPFRIIKKSFKLFCLSGGLALTRSSNGSISLLVFDRGDSVDQQLQEYTEVIRDFQNIGADPMIMGFLEYSDPVQAESQVEDFMSLALSSIL
ncbi:hypothetical protein [Robiginitalea sp. SC105]|uniref:hypothetical protein n=1 Tax=Robiginitalea sp. SC105 TaxID=2762332 RepID=UPI00163AEB78|nr:hypothetical protein [Robiginitalea sp. SC105]MBC2840404.1 hypothetical protein [Robiginitalea sp. SC105]